MPPPSDNPALHLKIHDGSFFVLQIPVNEPLPTWVVKELSGEPKRFFSITRTAVEISIVGEVCQDTPAEATVFSTWSCIQIAGPLEHSLTGILAAFSAPLKAAKISIYALSTWNTDYILIPTKEISAAKKVLEEDGWFFCLAEGGGYLNK